MAEWMGRVTEEKIVGRQNCLVPLLIFSSLLQGSKSTDKLLVKIGRQTLMRHRTGQPGIGERTDLW